MDGTSMPVVKTQIRNRTVRNGLCCTCWYEAARTGGVIVIGIGRRVIVKTLVVGRVFTFSYGTVRFDGVIMMGIACVL